MSIQRFLDDCDEDGRAVFSRIFTFAREKAMPINWGDPGVSP